MENKEINLRYGRVLPYNQPPSPPKEIDEDKEGSAPQANAPPYLERLVHPNHHTPEEVELLGELKNLCVKIPLLQASKDVPIYNKLIKEKCFKRIGRRRRDTPTINVVG